MVSNKLYKKKREPTAIGSFGLPHPHLPICRQLTYKRERLALFSERWFQCGRLNESSNKANASLFNMLAQRFARCTIFIYRAYIRDARFLALSVAAASLCAAKLLKIIDIRKYFSIFFQF